MEGKTMSLYIGANYHPHDWPEERWSTDIALMKEAGFTTVRLGHLCWDSYEPGEGVYTFEWFDTVMDLFAEAGIGVLLDITLRPAPVWVHKLCPGCNIYGKSGTYQASLRRYMEDVADPAYQHYALRFAEILVKRYKDHPALVAFGLCNEIGDGYLSHSEYARNRFSEWLKKKYGTVESLNEAWAARRWSRKLTSFEEVVMPENELAVGAPEAWLDMRRFWSDGIGDFLIQIKNLVDKESPDIPHSSNHYAEKWNLGFDYLKVYDQFVDYPGIGFYCPFEMTDAYFNNLSMYMQRLAETGKPMWCLEFQTGTKGVPFGPYGAVRRYVFLCLLNRAQMILGWTWRSMLGGEEQYLYGILSHDGVPTQNYQEYKQIASDMKKLQDYAFPYLPDPEIGVAYNYDSSWVGQYASFQYRMSYHESMAQVAKLFASRNQDYNVVDLSHVQGDYKLLIIPEHILMSREKAEYIRKYVSEGGTVIMTGYSASVDETNKVFGTPRPGYLDDVFGIRVAGHYRTDMECFFSEGAKVKDTEGKITERLSIQGKEDRLVIDADYYEVLELNTAEEFARLEGKGLCAVSVNHYGQGEAYYTAVETNETLLAWLIEQLSEKLGLQETLSTPQGVHARKIADDQYFYVNTTDQEVLISLERPGRGILTEQSYEKELVLKSYDGELIVTP